MEHGDQFLRSTLTGQIAKLEKLPRYFEILGLETDKNALSAINAHRELCRDDVLATADHVVLNQKRKKIENAIAQVAICINSKSVSYTNQVNPAHCSLGNLQHRESPCRSPAQRRRP